MGDNLSWMTGEINQQIKFLGSKFHFAATNQGHMRIQINTKIAVLNSATSLFLVRGTSQVRPHAGQQFADPERFGDVIVRSGVERLDFCSLFSLYGQYNDGRLRLGAKAAAQFQA